MDLRRWVKPRARLIGALAGTGALLLSVGCRATSAWDGSPVGKCFNSLDDYLVASFGPEHSSDENIKVVPVPSPRPEREERFVWVMDTTPNVNITRALFKLESHGRACAVLYAPMSNSVPLQLTAEGRLPPEVVTQDTPPAGLEANRIVYRLDPVGGNYAPAACFRITSAGTTRSIDCGKAYTDQ